MSPAFPIFIQGRDDGRIAKYASLGDATRALERIDVENGEYLAWDCNFLEVKMSVRHGSDWLELHTGEPAADAFRTAIERFLATADPDGQPGDDRCGDAESMFDAAVRRVSARRAKESWFERLKRRF